MIFIEKFEERVQEIELYFAFLKNLDEKKATLLISGKRKRSLVPDDDLLKILKANAYLLLYNVIESSVRSGLLAIYDSIKADGLSYDKLGEELRRTWISNVLAPAPDRTPDNSVGQVYDILQKIVAAEAVVFDPKKLRISGNVDARKVRSISDAHGFSHVTRGVNGGNKLVKVKMERNDLAHGHKSFIECGRDATFDDLDLIKKQVISFLRQILRNIARYIAKRKYAVV
ncbi:MAG TPA: MAE_28990/MAE_18760 family HEPN-like nuclease [Candidatus Angelobacter sp.]|nr:MAE_28990/MAE_18760 family HEPN-like nuclease [Candidatus Angelobacter sp.]